jgi:hypothetical protein
MPPYPNPQRDLQLQEPSRESSLFGPGGSQLSFWDRFRGKGRPYVGWTQSLVAIARSSCKHISLIHLVAPTTYNT